MDIRPVFKFAVLGFVCLALGVGLTVILLRVTSGGSPSGAVASDASAGDRATELVTEACGIMWDGVAGDPAPLVAEAAQLDGRWIDLQEALTYHRSLVVVPPQGHPEHANYQDAVLTMESACERAKSLP
jgi:hypothetical protein